MVSEALPVQHPRASDSQGFTPKPSAAVRMQEEHGGFQSRFVTYFILNISTHVIMSFALSSVVFKPSLPVFASHVDLNSIFSLASIY